jgi:hypothetical protein
MTSEGTMKPAFIFATMLWLAAFTTAQAQETQVGSTGTVATDPLSVPTSTIPLSGGFAAATGSLGGINAASSINPQTAVQLPGETSNTATQSPTTTASAPAASSAASAGAGASGTLCSSSVSSTSGELSAASLAGGISTNGC